MITVSKTKLPGVLLIKPDVFKDFRGVYVETYNEALYKKKGIKVAFVQDDYSASKKNVLRGIHGDKKTYKLISCSYGEFYFVVVNCDKKSKYFGKWQSFIISSENRWQVLVPPNHGNAHLVLKDWSVFNYKQSTYYNPKSQFSYKWNDPIFKVTWPIKNPILSLRDKNSNI